MMMIAFSKTYSRPLSSILAYLFTIEVNNFDMDESKEIPLLLAAKESGSRPSLWETPFAHNFIE